MSQPFEANDKKKPIFVMMQAKIGSSLIPFDSPSIPTMGQVALRHPVARILPFRWQLL
jgi:hypothetical protein